MVDLFWQILEFSTSLTYHFIFLVGRGGHTKSHVVSLTTEKHLSGLIYAHPQDKVLSQAVCLLSLHPQDYVTSLHALVHVTQVPSAVLVFPPTRTVITHHCDVTVDLAKRSACFMLSYKTVPVFLGLARPCKVSSTKRTKSVYLSVYHGRCTSSQRDANVQFLASSFFRHGTFCGPWASAVHLPL